MHSFTFSKASQARFEHHGKDKRGRGDIFRIETPYRTLEVYVTNEGRAIRVADAKGRELK